MCGGVLPACMYLYHVHVVPPTPRNQKRVLDPVRLELPMIVSCRIGAWNLGKRGWGS